MRSGSAALGAAVILIAAALPCRPQVLAPAEILDPAMRQLQQEYLPELKEAAVDITAHNYPYKFYLSRTLDITEKQELATDQRSIRFAKFQDRTVLQITGNYFAAYSDETMNRNERVKRTYLDVILPILRATEPRLDKEKQVDAFAIEISHHVRKRVLGVTLENPENIALIVPKAVAESAVASQDVTDELAALKNSALYIDSKPASLGPVTPPAQPAAQAAANQAVSPVAPLSPAAPTPVPAPPASARDLSQPALQQQQTSLQPVLDQMVKELDSQAHFVPYAPPALVAFHNMSYLQLTVATTLAPTDSGSQYRLAALAFDRHISHLIRPVLGYFKQAPGFDGIDFSSTVKIPSATPDSALAQSVEFFFPLAELRRYEQYDITGQQLINAGFVLINGERVGLDLQSAEAGPR